MVIIHKPVILIGYNFFPIYILMCIKYDPNSAPNKVFTRRISGIGYLLTSLIGSRTWDVYDSMLGQWLTVVGASLPLSKPAGERMEQSKTSKLSTWPAMPSKPSISMVSLPTWISSTSSADFSWMKSVWPSRPASCGLSVMLRIEPPGGACRSREGTSSSVFE
jgi:hypothetical protein